MVAEYSQILRKLIVSTSHFTVEIPVPGTSTQAVTSVPGRAGFGTGSQIWVTWIGVSVGVAVAVAVEVAVGVKVLVGVKLGVAVKVFVGVKVFVAVGVGVKAMVKTAPFTGAPVTWMFFSEVCPCPIKSEEFAMR